MHQTSSTRGRHWLAVDAKAHKEDLGYIPSAGPNREMKTAPDRRRSPFLPPPSLSLPHSSLQDSLSSPLPPSQQQMLHSPPPLSRIKTRPKPTQTPSTTRIHDMLGPTDMGELSVIFGELVRMLKELPPGVFDKAYGS